MLAKIFGMLVNIQANLPNFSIIAIEFNHLSANVMNSQNWVIRCRPLLNLFPNLLNCTKNTKQQRVFALQKPRVVTVKSIDFDRESVTGFLTRRNRRETVIRV